MNKHSKITGTSAPLSDPRKPERACVPQSLNCFDIGAPCHSRDANPTVAAGAPNRDTFRFRTEVCEAHDTATATSCEECDRGMVDSICCVCNRVVPLDDDGYCARCLEPSEGFVFVERIAPGRIAC